MPLIAEIIQTTQPGTLDPIVDWLKSFHGEYPLVGILILMMGFDVGMGFVAAFVTQTVSSSVCSTGMVKKVGILLLVGMSAAIEPYAQGLPMSKLAAMAFIVFEATSIIENAARAGLPIPSIITETLMKLKQAEKASVGKKEPGPITTVNVAKAENVNVDAHNTQDPPLDPTAPPSVKGVVVPGEAKQKGPGSSFVLGPNGK